MTPPNPSTLTQVLQPVTSGLLSLLLLIAGILALIKAATPDWKWPVRKKEMNFRSTNSIWNRTLVKNPEPSPSAKSAEQRERTERLRKEAAEREKARREIAERERNAELERQRAERERIRAAEKQARKVKFQEFINAPMTKIVVGFTIILVGGWAELNLSDVGGGTDAGHAKVTSRHLLEEGFDFVVGSQLWTRGAVVTASSYLGCLVEAVRTAVSSTECTASVGALDTAWTALYQAIRCASQTVCSPR